MRSLEGWGTSGSHHAEGIAKVFDRNRDVYTQHRIRFRLVPLVLFLALGASRWISVTGFALAALGDVYHTSMQNFGFCRIYDSKVGNDAQSGQLLDV
jgi:hypothetical protein